MASLRKTIKDADPVNEKKEEIMLNLNLLFELATSKCEQFKSSIEERIRTAGSPENPTIPITNTIGYTTEIRSYCSDDSANIVNEATSAIKKFISGGADNVINGVGQLLTTAINALLGAAAGVQNERSDYFIMVDGFALVRLDIKSWVRRVEVKGITQKVESAMAFTAVKSSVDIEKISFNTFMQAYRIQLESDTKSHWSQADLLKEIQRAKDVYKSLKCTDSADETIDAIPFDQLELPGAGLKA